MKAHGPKDLLVRVNETLDDLEEDAVRLERLAEEFLDIAQRNRSLVNRIRTRNAELDDSDGEKHMPDIINPQKRPGAEGELSGEAGERVAKAIAEAIGDGVNVQQSEAA